MVQTENHPGGVVDCPRCGAYHTVIVEYGECWSVCGCESLTSEQWDEAIEAAKKANP